MSWDSSPPPPESVRTYADDTTKIFRIDRLANVLSSGAPLGGFARRLRYKDTAIISSAIKRYDRHPSIKSIKSMTLITAITGGVVSIDFYRLIDTIDNVYVIDIDSYRFIERFSDIDFYRLPRLGIKKGQTVSCFNTLTIKTNLQPYRVVELFVVIRYTATPE